MIASLLAAAALELCAGILMAINGFNGMDALVAFGGTTIAAVAAGALTIICLSYFLPIQ